MDILEYIRGYQHVADFQKLCGVEIVQVDEIVHKNGGSPNGRNRSGSNGFSSDHEHKNGVRKRDTDTAESNGVMHKSNSFTNGIVNPDGHEVQLAYKIHNKFLFYLMHFGAGLGSEYFYIIFFPFMVWNIDSRLCRQLLLIWAPLMYFGQYMKDWIQWSRPGPPAVRLEGKRFENEYGFPSTHCIVGTCIPFSLLVLTSRYYEFPFLVGLAIAVCWSGLVACSRVYLGMHTIIDCVTGIALTALCLPGILTVVEEVEYFLVTNICAPFFSFLLPLLACVLYPKPKLWSVTRGDTSNIVSIASMVIVISWLIYHLGWLKESTYPSGRQPFPQITVDWVLYSTVRTIVGVVALAGSRILMKRLSVKFVCHCAGVDVKDIDRQRQLGLEVPVRWFTIGGLAVHTTFTAPIVFNWLGIAREAYYSELGLKSY